jgi:predicted GTPase
MSPTTYQAQKQQVLSLCDTAITLAQKYGTQIIEKNLYEAKEYLAQRKLFVVVCGEFKQGKSSLINALLNEPKLFPVDVDIATSLVSTITYGEKEKITVILGEPGKEKAKEIRRDEIANYVTEQGNKKNIKQARLLAIEVPNPQLKEGLVIADTPGVGGLNKNHTDISYAFIPNADAILFVSDALVPLSTDELKFVEMIKRHCQNFIFVITKIDQKADYRTVVENNREKLAQVLERSAEQIPIIPVSSYLKEVYLQDRDPEDLEDSNFPTLETKLWQFLNQQRGYILIMRALTKLGQHVSEIKRPRQAELEAYQKTTQEELAQMEQKVREAEQDLRELQSGGATWQKQLNEGLKKIRSNLLKDLQQGLSQLSRRSEEYADDERLLADPAQIASLLETDMDALMTELGEQLSQRAAELNAQIETSTGLNMNPFEEDSLVWQKPEFTFADKSIKKTGWWEKSVNTVGNGIFKGGVGGTIGGTLGGTVGGIIGLLFGGVGALPGVQIGAMIGSAIGSIAGFGTGAKQSLEQVKDKEKGSVLKLLREFIGESKQACQTALTEGIEKLESFMRDELIQKMKQEQENCKQVLQSIANSRKLSQEQAAQKAVTLKEPLQQLDRLLNNAETLAKAVIQQNEATSVNESDRNKPTPKADNQSDYGDFADDD